MKIGFLFTRAAPAVALLTLMAACDREGVAARDVARAAAVPAAQAAPPPTNRIDVPAAVRQNLGITFARVERRRVASTLRVPGRFELLPSARREHRATLAGWVRLRVNQYDAVQAGAPLFELDSPDWHKLRKQLHEGRAGIEAAAGALAVAEQTLAEAEKAVALAEQRLASAVQARAGRAELELELAARRNAVPKLKAELELRRAALGEARHDFALEVDTAAALLGLTAEHLTETVTEQVAAPAGHHGEHAVQRWYTIDKVGFSARGAGVVESVHVADGGWAEQNALVVTVVDPAALRFRATGLQSDLGRLRDGLSAAVVPPQGTAIDPAAALPGELKIGLAGDPERRTIDLLVTPAKSAPWARPGVSALLEVVVDDAGSEALAIPASAVVRDELTYVFFRRDPKDPDRVIRMEADLGVSDGRWVAVNSGVKAGDEVVLDGAYELMLAGGGRAAGGGHFHADGTWHAGPDESEK